MMDWTDRHCRVFHRLMTRRARLYTEMLTTGAIIRGERKRLLGFDASEHPVALQLGGSEPLDLATAAKIGEDFGYDEINLNVGCPSDRVKDALPDAPIIINGGIDSVAEAKQHLTRVDGVMLGRAAYQDPWRLLTVDTELFGEAAPCATMKDVFEAMMPYIERELAAGTRLHSITRHFVGAFHGVPGARAFRRHLAERGVKPDADVNVLCEAIALVGGRAVAPMAA